MRFVRKVSKLILYKKKELLWINGDYILYKVETYVPSKISFGSHNFLLALVLLSEANLAFGIAYSYFVALSFISSTFSNLFPFKSDFNFGNSQKSLAVVSGLY